MSLQSNFGYLSRPGCTNAAHSGVFGFASSHEILFALLEFAPVALAVTLWGAFSLDSMLPPDAEADQVEKWEGRSMSMTGDSVGRL